MFRKKAEPIKPRKIIRRKCKQCGKMKTNPYTYTEVPSISIWDTIPIYNRNAIKTDRIDLKGTKKVAIKYYCDQECHTTYIEQNLYRMADRELELMNKESALMK